MPRPVILVVDDDPGVRESFRLILEAPSDVLDDIRLPEMDGIETIATRVASRLA